MESIFKSMAVAACAAMLMASCGEQDVKVDVVKVDMVEALAPEIPDSVHVSVSLEYPVGGVSDSVKVAMNEAIVTGVFGPKYAGMEIRDAVGKWAQGVVADYRSTNLEFVNDMKAEGEDFYTSGILSWVDDIEGAFSGKYKDIVSYTVNEYIYTGGAHGSSGESSVNMDMKTGKRVTEEDLLVDGYKDGLAALLTAHLHDSLPDQEAYDGLFIKDIVPNGNFKVSELGLTYVYGQYEIGPYALGIIEVTVPWDELSDLLR